MADTHAFDIEPVRAFVNAAWDESIIPKLCEYISIPNQSPAFDSEWETNGLLDKAMALIVDWVRAQPVAGMQVELLKEAGRTPLLFIEVAASAGVRADHTVLLYGHMDKQPPLHDGWEAGLGPYTPVIRDGKLYGRGGADDGYSTFAAVTAIVALQRQGIAHGRCVIIIEAAEESGSDDLPHYVQSLLPRIGTPDLVVCLDSGAGNYDTFWATTTLRGVLMLTVDFRMLTEGVHSGAASGVVPSSFRVARQVLARLEDAETGKMAPPFFVDIPPQRVEEAREAVAALGDTIWQEFPFVAGAGPTPSGARPTADQLLELYLNKTWRPTLSITGAAGMPPPPSAGNVLRTNTTLKLSIRLPPSANAAEVEAAARKLITDNPPYGAQVSILASDCASGWAAPIEKPWLKAAMNAASLRWYGHKAMALGEGGTIPFMGMLGEKFPAAQFVVTGLLGPKSNAHGPNEFLAIDFAKRLNGVVAELLAVHARQA